MAPRGTIAMGEKTPSPGRPSMRKAASHEPLGSPVPLSGGGVSLASHYASARASPTPTRTSHRNQRRTASDDGTPNSTNSSAFLAGSSGEEEVLTEASSDAPAEASPANNNTQLQMPPVRVDAQGIYPGTACMFVANLAQTYGDGALEEAVTQAFSKYGQVWAKIKRDPIHMPYAFCQFTNDRDAQRAQKLGQGVIILGRPCRTEISRAGTFIVSKRNGTSLTIAEATNLLSELGEIAKAEFFIDKTPRFPGAPMPVLVKYKMYDAGRETLRHFASNPTFLVIAHKPKRRNDFQPSAGKWDGGNALMHRYDRDRRSAYVGNLPDDMTEDVLRTLASSSGEVMSVQLYNRDVPGRPGKTNCFAFIEFARPDGADVLMTNMNGTEIDGKYIRVERKQSRIFETSRHETRNPNGWSTVPRRRGVSSFTAPQTSGAEVDGTRRMERNECHNRTVTYTNKSYSYGQGRRPRQTIFSADTSVGKALSELDLGPASKQAGSVQDLKRSGPKHNSRASASPSKKPTEFALPNGSRSGTRPSTPTETAVNGGQHVAAPTISEASSGAATTAVNATQSIGHQASAGVMMQTPYAWSPAYQPYPQGYPYMAGAVAPLATGNDFMFQPCMAHQYAHPLMYHYNMMPQAPLAHPVVAPAGQHFAMGQGNGGFQGINTHPAAAPAGQHFAMGQSNGGFHGTNGYLPPQ